MKTLHKIFLTLLLFFISVNVSAQECIKVSKAPNTKFKSKTQFARYEQGWYDEWLKYTNGVKKLPDPLPPQKKWDHPYMKYGYTSAMHEGPKSTDVSNLPGPGVDNIEVQYFHVLNKGGDFSGMCPTFAFLNDSTMITLSFGRANTTLLMVDIKDTLRVIDYVGIPGRGSSAFELAGKKGRSKIFSNTSGGAYTYLSGKDRVYIPGANNNILRVSIKDRHFLKDKIESINIKHQIEEGNYVDSLLSKKDKLNKLTALIPDVDGNIWFTSRNGVIGMIHRHDVTAKGCPKIYATFIGYYGLRTKIERYFPQSLKEINKIEKNIIHLDSVHGFEREAVRHLLNLHGEEEYEQIQNSFSVGKDGIYIVSNVALYKFRFNNKTKRIELDPKWAQTFRKDKELVYENDLVKKPGHLNIGSGTTPTLIDDRFVAICDNAADKVNLCVYSQENGKLISKLPLFGDNGSAVENSVVAYKNSLIVANTYGYSDPFQVNKTPGGIMRFDFVEKAGTYKKVEGWPEGGSIDCKTATPKLSTKRGMLYVYNRSDTPVNGNYDWQITGIDFRTGRRVIYVKPYFLKGEFKDNIGPVIKWGSLGTKNYDRKVFNNIWGTYTFGPENSFYIGTYRGFIRVSSD